ncbi:hypothetical protein LBC_06360 [Campylobacter sp. 19-13652]|nr:hypothetical protein LBC_06360 [Campylobacter sp. 19-13652]
MALPFLVGAAAGALAVIAFNKKDELLKEAKTGIKKGKEAAIKAYKNGKSEVNAIVSSGEKEVKKLAKKPTARKSPVKKATKAE